MKKQLSSLRASAVKKFDVMDALTQLIARVEKFQPGHRMKMLI